MALCGKRRSESHWHVNGWSTLIMLLILSLQSALPGWSESIALTEVVRQTMAIHFNPKPTKTDTYKALIQHFSTVHAKPAGVFVTLSQNGKPRACWGSPYPQYKTTLEATVYATLGALTKEYRYKPISQTEWSHLKPQVTVVKAIEPVDSLSGQNPLRDGLMVRQGSRSGVILPGEARDATYQLVQCKLKAGIRPGEKFQLYRIIADVYQ